MLLVGLRHGCYIYIHVYNEIASICINMVVNTPTKRCKSVTCGTYRSGAMAEEDEYVAGTIATIGSLITKPKMTEKYLKKPPFRRGAFWNLTV